MIDRVFRGKDLSKVKEEALAFIDKREADGWKFQKVNVTREDDERVLVVYMTSPQ